MERKISKFVYELADREAIRDCLYRYCRAIDRMDADLLMSVYWEDATDEHGNFIAHSPQEVIATTFPIMQEKMERTTHTIQNMLITLDGDTAYIESYVQAIHRLWGNDGQPYDRMSCSRFIDRMERRNDEWRIRHRVVVRDWFREFPDSCEWIDGVMGKALGFGKDKPLDIGQRKPDDLSYSILPSLA